MNFSKNIFPLALSAFLLASCGGGSSSSDSTSTPPPTGSMDTTPPVVSFDPPVLLVTSSATGDSALAASDNVGITSGPNVDCTNGGSFAGGIFTAPNVTSNVTSVCTATASDSAGNQGSATLTVTIVGPVEFNPQTMTSAPSVFASSGTLSQVLGLTPNADNGFRIYWEENVIGSQIPTSFQDFTADGTLIGAQTDGEFQATQGVLQVTDSVHLSGDTIFNVNIARDNSTDIPTLTTHRGEVSGQIFDLGDLVFPLRSRFTNIDIPIAALPNGNNLFLVYQEDESDESESISSYIINADGSHVMTRLDEASDNGKRVLENLVLPDGTLLAVWAEFAADGAETIYLQNLSVDGSTIGNRVIFDPNAEAQVTIPSIGVLENGNLFATWLSEGASNLNNPAFQAGGIFDINGLPVSDVFTLNEYDPNRARANSTTFAALNGNQMMVVNRIGVPFTSNIQIMVFDADGNPTSVPIFVGSTLSQESNDPLTIVFPDNRVVMAWNRFEEDAVFVNFFPIGQTEP